MSARSKSRTPARVKLPDAARIEALGITARIQDLIAARSSVIRAAAGSMGLDVEKNDYRVSDDWSHLERVVVPLPKQQRRAVREARRAARKAS